jgi:hypothetical protein
MFASFTVYHVIDISFAYHTQSQRRSWTATGTSQPVGVLRISLHGVQKPPEPARVPHNPELSLPSGHSRVKGLRRWEPVAVSVEDELVLFWHRAFD